MTDLASVPSVLRIRLRSGGPELPARELAAGGEARVYALPGPDRLVAKVYHAPTPERARKLAWMIENPPALPPGVRLAWPVEPLSDGGRFAGFVMPFAEGPRVFELYNPVTRRDSAPLFHWGLLHRAGARVAAAFEALHARGYVVGDVNESNFLVSPDASVTVVDTDSFQVRDGSGALFRSRVGKAEFTPPELQGVSFGDVDRTPEHDRFGLAVLLFLLLMEGTHPFAARFRPGEEAPPLEERIRRGLFPYAAEGGAPVRPPRLAPPFEALDPALRALFVTAFVDGYADPSARPTAAEWRAALETAEALLAVCDENPQHRYAPHVDACPWCARAWLLRGRDPFPATVEAARRTAVARAPREAPAARPAAPPVAARPSGGAPFFPGPGSAAGWAPAPAAPAGMLNPATWLLPMLTLMVAGGGMAQWIGLGGLGLALGAICIVGRRPRGVVGNLALLLVVLAWIVATATRPAPDLLLPPSAEDGTVARDDAPGQPVPAPAEDPAPEGGPDAEPVYQMWQVERWPVLTNGPEIEAALREARVVGRAEVWATLGTDGRVDESTLEARGSSGADFTLVALELARRTRHTPAMLDGRPVRVAVKIPLEYTGP